MEEISHQKITAFIAQYYNFKPIDIIRLEGYADENFRITTSSYEHFLFKISHNIQDKEPLFFQNALLNHLNKNGFNGHCPKVINTVLGSNIIDLSTDKFNRFGRLFTWLDGKSLTKNEMSLPDCLVKVGQFFAKLDSLLLEFRHPNMHQPSSWDLSEALRCEPMIADILEEEARRHAHIFMQRFATHTLAKLAKCRKSVIHNDGNEQNILLDSRSNKKHSLGIIDFGDSTYTYTICELAILATYMLFDQNDPLASLCTLVAGYHKKLALKSEEIELLYDLIGLRCAVSLAHSYKIYKKDPSQTYCLISQKPAKRLLTYLVSSCPEKVTNALYNACEMPTPTIDSSERTKELRNKNILNSLTLSYKNPLHMVRGQMQYLFDHKGNTYLDSVNNVCHVGHCHPMIVKAQIDACSILNTNTRYLHNLLGLYSDKLLSTFPNPLKKLVMVCSGSEANDLAARMCMETTGGDTFITMEGAYHGNTVATMRLSPYKKQLGYAPFHTIVLPIPSYKPESREQDIYFSHVQKTIEKQLKLGRKIAGFFCESILSCGGQKTLPNGFLKTMYEITRSHGGLCVADEVQVGFGRIGSHMWAFMEQDVNPDLVSLGKSMANGHPVGGLVISEALAKRFSDNGVEYFNTYGGNPVSCAIANAVLDVIYEENLLRHAKEVGLYFKERLANLQSSLPIIKEIRGYGLFIGIEFHSDQIDNIKNIVAQIVNQFIDYRILTSQDGLRGEVIKIKPPLVFNKYNADQYTDALQLIIQGLV